jgi:hypothetical protein
MIVLDLQGYLFAETKKSVNELDECVSGGQGITVYDDGNSYSTNIGLGVDSEGNLKDCEEDMWLRDQWQYSEELGIELEENEFVKPDIDDDDSFIIHCENHELKFKVSGDRNLNIELVSMKPENDDLKNDADFNDQIYDAWTKCVMNAYASPN